MTDSTFRVGLLLFTRVTQLDMTGPYEVFTRMPGAMVDVIAKTREPVTSDQGLTFVPSASFDEVDRLDLVCVPGGPGIGPLLEDDQTLTFLRRVAHDVFIEEPIYRVLEIETFCMHGALPLLVNLFMAVLACFSRGFVNRCEAWHFDSGYGAG